MPLRNVVSASAVTLALIAHGAPVQAAPPTSRVVATAFSLPSSGGQWVTHEIVKDERLDQIAERYAVSVGSILRWNQLDPLRPQFWVGQQLKVLTQLPNRVRTKVLYVVRAKDTWGSIAERYHVEPSSLQKVWNPAEKKLAVGRQLTLWVEPDQVAELPDPGFTIKPVEVGAVSVGWPDNGRLRHGVQIPQNPELYTVRNVDHAWGSTHAIEVLQKSIATFRLRTGYDQPITLWDMSMKSGGRYGPHRSHRSGRDIDIGLPMNENPKKHATPKRVVDWTAMWHMVRAMVETEQVRYVFLSRIQQASLYKAAKACGATNEELDRVMQYPRFKKLGIVRDAPGHTGHLHVRFLCGPDEKDCREYY
jgi:murein endopeptidase